MIENLLASIEDPPEIQRVRLRGADEVSVAWWLAKLADKCRSSLVFVGADTRRLRQVEANLRFFLGGEEEKKNGNLVYLFPEWDVYPYARISPSSEVVGERMAAIDFLLTGGPGILLTTPRALSWRIPPPSRFEESSLHLREGEEIDHDRLLGDLEDLMYVRRSIVESPGEYAVRGGLVDFFTPQERRPVRVDLRGDVIDSLREFHPQTQRTLVTRSEIRVFPARELILTDEEMERGAAALREAAGGVPDQRVDRLLDHLSQDGHFSGIEGLAPLFLTGMGSLFDIIPGDAVFLLDDPEAIASAAKEMWTEVEEEASLAEERGLIAFEPSRLWLSPEEMDEGISLWPRVELDSFGLDETPDRDGRARESVTLTAEHLSPIRGRFANFAGQLLEWLKADEKVVIVAADRTQALRVHALLKEQEISVPILPPGEGLGEEAEKLVLTEGRLSSSVRLPAERRIFFRTDDIFAPSIGRRRLAPGKSRSSEGLGDLKEGSYIVHIDHGVGQFLGARVLGHIEGEDEFLHIAYAGGDKLYVPMDDIDRVHIYRGAGSSPILDKLGGAKWAKTKKGVKKALQSIARDLVRLYSERGTVEGVSFGPEGTWDSEIAAGFEYEETPDQDQAIRDVLADMEKSRPMDRLICGDVGYGKTEVALRAAVRAVSSGRQVALVVPTTLLAHQHWETFRERLKSLPVEVEMLSRFRTRKEQAEVVEGMAAGKVDIVIGTHRLLQKDIKFKDLGLLIVDEEHRFGVVHKEKFKKMRINVDVLTLTATPIPRTLQLALSGARDLSTIETPPLHRLAPRTYIARFTKKVVADAIRREMDRGGQVFFVHNRVHSLPAMARFIENAVPEVRLLIGHGQMKEKLLEDVMEKFVSRKADVLLCTSIIESGLDIPSVNTILISRADTFGMAQLYQLRGRVGRARFQAHAYLLVPGTESLTPVARERLQALEELSELGAGFKLASRDLEIRGAGHLLGHRQSGRIAAVGFEMYCRLLEEVLQESRGRTVEYQEPDLVFPVAGSVPPAWVPGQTERLEIYRQAASATSPAEFHEIKAELSDRFGPLPPRALRLLQMGEIRVRCRSCGVKSLHIKGKMANFETFPGDYELSAAFLNTSGMIFTGTHHFQLSLTGDWDNNFAQLVELLETFEACSVESVEDEADSDGGDTALTAPSAAGEESP